MNTLSGIDVSAIGQGPNFNWEAYRGKIQFAGIKISEDVNFADIDANVNLKGADRIGAIPMAYHFLHALPSGTEQANWFMSHCRSAGVQRGDLLALDVEQGGMDGQTASSLWARAVEAANTIKHHFDVWPVIYTDISLAMVAPAAIGAAPLWLANPSGTHMTAIGPWPVISFEQTGQRGVDTDVFYGSAEQLRTLAVPLPAPPSPPVVAPPSPPVVAPPSPPVVAPPSPPTVRVSTGLLVTVAGGIITAKAVTSKDGKNWS